MDSNEIFKKLSFGAVFTKRRNIQIQHIVKTEEPQKTDCFPLLNNVRSLNSEIVMNNEVKSQKKQKNLDKLKLMENEEV